MKTARAIMATVCLLAGTTLAVDRVFTVNNGNLNVAGNWDPEGIPGVGDKGTVGDGINAIQAFYTTPLAGPPDAIVVNSNGAIILNNTSMTAEHNLILNGGTLRANANYAYGSSISLRSESRFLSIGNDLSFTGRIQNAVADAGLLIVTNSSTNLAGSVAIRAANSTYSGGTLVCPGTLNLSSVNSLGTGPTDFLPGSKILVTGNSSQQSRFTMRDGLITWAAGYTFSVTNAIRGTLQLNNSGNTPTLGGLVEDFSPEEPGRVVKTGSGLIYMGSSNSYSGGTLIQKGSVGISGVPWAFGNGPVTVTNGAEILLYNAKDVTWPGWEVEILNNATLKVYSVATTYATNVRVRAGGIIKGREGGNFASSDQLMIEGRVTLLRYGSWNHGWYGTFRDGSEPGRLVFSGTGNGNVQFGGVNTYTGGTEIEDNGPGTSPFKLSSLGRMPDTGEILVHQNGVMDFNSVNDTAGSLAGVGRVNLGTATVSLNEGFSPGTNLAAFGTLTVTGATGRIVLGESAISLFHLGSPGADQDRVVMEGTAGLTLGGTIRIGSIGVLKSGQYTLFDLASGSLRGDIPSLDLPAYCTGAIVTNSGDVVLSLKAPTKGTLVEVR